MIQLLAKGLGSCAWHMKGSSARVTRKNIALCFPSLDQQTQDTLARNSLVETAKTILEMGKAWLAPTGTTLGYIQSVRDEVDIEAVFAKGKGVIIVAPHLGNWEVLNVYIGDRFPLNIMYQPLAVAELDDFVRNARARVGAKVLPADRRGVAAMFKALRQGEMVGILPDMEPPEAAGVYVPFLGVDALTMTLISKLAQKTEATVIYGYAKRLPRGKGFEVVIKAADAGIYSPDVDVSVAALSRSVQACVEGAVEQYQWEYKRFKHKPGGKTWFYKF